jgi:DNA helicase II / ATP-dependent DNA helicase PcrA
VRLSTVHQAKGLEYGVVFVIMLCDGLFPSSRAMETEEGEEEERRLFYVAVTRAKDELYLTHPRLRMGKGGDAWQTPSRFLNELNRDLVNVWRVKGSAGLGDWS